MSEHDSEQAELDICFAEQHEQRQTGDDAGKNQGQQHEAPEQGFPGELSAIQGQRREHTECQRDSDRRERHHHAITNRFPNSRVCKEHAIPIERQVVRGESAHSFAVKRIDDEHGNRQIEECKNRHCMHEQPAGTAGRISVIAHVKLHFFSSRSEMNRSPTTSTSMHREMAAPSGQL